MLKRILINAGILMIGIVLYSLSLNGDPEAATKPSVTEEEQNLAVVEKVSEELHKKYVGLDVKTTSNKELVIRVAGDEDYFNSVKKDMESAAKSAMKTTPLKDYIVVLERLDLSLIPKEINSRNDEVTLLMEALLEGLKEYDVVGDVMADDQKLITIQTSIKDSDKKAQQLGMQIEETANEILQCKELNSVSHMDSYYIRIVNAKGEAVN